MESGTLSLPQVSLLELHPISESRFVQLEEKGTVGCHHSKPLLAGWMAEACIDLTSGELIWSGYKVVLWDYFGEDFCFLGNTTTCVIWGVHFNLKLLKSSIF